MKIDQNYFKIKDEGVLNIDSTLNKNESILWKSRPKHLSYALQKCASFFPIALLWGAIDFSMIFFIIKNGQLPFAMILFILCFFALHLTPVWIFFAQLIKGLAELKYNKYYITNERIINQSGKSGRIIDEIPLEQIQSVNIKRSFWDKLFRVGDIYINGDKTSTVFFDIHDSEMIFSKLEEIVKMASKEAKNKTFYENNTICEYCGSYYDKNSVNCPICGAKNTFYKKD